MTGGGGARPGYLGALRSRPFALLLLAHGLATTAQLVLVLAVGVAVLERTGSGFWLSAVVALSFLPYAVFSSLSGVLVDRTSRSALMAATSGTRAVLTGLAALGCWHGWPVPVVVAVAAAGAVVATPSYPALAAATPQCVGREHLPAANALATSVENGCWIAGPGVFGSLVALGVPSSGAVLLAAVLLAAAAGCAAAAGLRPVRRPRAGAWTELAGATQTVVATPAIRRPMGWAVLDNLLYGYLVVAVVVLTEDRAGGLGRLNAALAVGAVAAVVVVNRLAQHAGPALLPVTLAVFAASVAALGVAGPGLAGAALVLLAGATTLVAEVAAVTALQEGADAGLLGRVMGLYDQVNVGAVAVGSFLAGPLADLVGARTALVAVGGGAAVVALSGAVPPLGWRRSGALAPPRVPPCPRPAPPTSSSCPPSTSRAAVPSSSSRELPAPRRPSGTPSRLP